MDIRTYSADTIREALDQIRRELGDDAIILHTRNVMTGGVLGFGQKKKCVEVTASNDARILEPEQQISYEHKRYRKAAAEAPKNLSPGPGTPPAATSHDIMTEVRELRKLVEMLSSEMDARDLPPQAAHWLGRLTEGGVRKPIARRLVADAARSFLDAESVGDDEFAAAVRTEVGGMMFVSGGIGQKGKRGARVVAVIGPTGVGKTTSIAKLASDIALNARQRVAFVTADTYRIAATEQLRVYADLIHVPMDVVYGPDDIEKAVECHLQRDYVFIDTAGSSQFNEDQMAELCAYLKAAACDEIYLLVSATTDHDAMGEIIERFSVARPTCILFSKLDETTRQGVLINTFEHTSLPASYLSTGQNVPDDIEPATIERMTQLVLGEADTGENGSG